MYICSVIDINEYNKIHSWIRKTKGKANRCDNIACRKVSTVFQHALKNECNYDYKEENFIQLCGMCHSAYDADQETRGYPAVKKQTNNPNTKTRTFVMRMTESQYMELKICADKETLSMSALIRRLINVN